MEFSRYLETKFEKKFIDVLQDLREDQEERSLWNSQAEIGWRIRNSYLPTTEPIESLTTSNGVFFKDNWVKKSANWLVSYLTGAETYADVVSHDGIYKPQQELLENEVNYAMSLSKLERINSLAARDWFYTGVGVVRTHFDPRKINNFWKTGTPIISHVDSRNFWFKGTDSYLSDVSRMFHAEAVDTEELKANIAQYSKEDAAKIAETSYNKDEHFPDIKGRTIVYTGIYKKVVRIQKREFISETTNIEEGENNTVNWFEFEEEYQDLALTELPEGVSVAPTPVDVDLDCWYQIIFIPAYSLIVKQPVIVEGKAIWKDHVYVGETPNYHILGGMSQDGSSYPYGQAYELKDILDLSVVFMSSLAKQVGNMNRPQPQIFEGAIANLNEFTNKHWKSDFVLKLDKDFFDDNQWLNPQDAVTYKQTPINDRLFLVMQNYITEAIKTSTGAVDSARGQQQYSGQSGVLANQLQMASQTYLKDDEGNYKAFLDSILNWLMNTIVLNRQHPHLIKGIDEDGEEVPREVNTNMYNTLEADDYVCEANLQPNAETLKQQEKQLVLELLNGGKFPLKQALQILDLSSVNIEQTMTELNKEKGLEQIAELIQKYPQIQEQIMAMAQELESGGAMQQ